MKQTLFTALSAVLLFTACKKDDKEPTAQDKLTGKWQMTAGTATVTMLGVPPVPMDLLAQMQPCEKDNLMEFMADKTLFKDEGATKCNGTDPQRSQMGSWDLVNNNNGLRLTTGSSSTVYDIKELTTSSLKLHMDTTMNISGMTASYVMDMTYQKK